MDAREIIDQWRNWRMPIVKVPESVLPFRSSDRIEGWIAVGTELPWTNTKALTTAGIFIGAERRAELRNKHTLIEATSGNTGKVMASIARHYGFKNVVLVMKSDVPRGKQFPGLINGARVVTPAEGLSTIATARVLGQQEGWWNPDQYRNQDGMFLHRLFTGPRILEGIGACPNLFAAPIGTGGSICGTAEFLRKYGELEVVGVLLHDKAEVPGMRDEPGMRDVEIPWRKALLGAAPEKVWTRESYYMSMCLNRVLGVSIGPSAGSGYLGAILRLLSHKRDGTLDVIRGRDGIVRFVVLAPDGYEVYGDRYDAQIHTQDSEPTSVPLPWNIFPERFQLAV